MAGDVEGHGVGAGVQRHLVQILKVVDIRQDAAAGGVVLQVIQHAIHLIHLPLRVPVLHRQLVAVGLADGAALVRPAVPDVSPQVVDVVGLLLPDPQQLVDAGLEVRPADGEDGELHLQVVAVDDAEFLHRVCGCAVLPVGTHVLIRVPHAVGEDLPAVFLEYAVCVAHGGVLLCDFCHCTISPGEKKVSAPGADTFFVTFCGYRPAGHPATWCAPRPRRTGTARQWRCARPLAPVRAPPPGLRSLPPAGGRAAAPLPAPLAGAPAGARRRCGAFPAPEAAAPASS